MNNKLFPIANAGWNYIAYAFGSLIIFSLLNIDLLQLVSFVVLVFFLFVFRNPERELPNFEEKSVLCPVDGEVIAIDELDDSEFLYKVTIDTTYKDVSVLRTPMSATVVSLEKKHGTRLSLDNPLAKITNENVNIIFEDINQNKIKVSHTLKQTFCEIVVDLNKDKKVKQSSRYGLMVNGVTEIYLPHNFRLNLVLGEEATASDSLVGYFS